MSSNIPFFDRTERIWRWSSFRASGRWQVAGGRWQAARNFTILCRLLRHRRGDRDMGRIEINTVPGNCITMNHQPRVQVIADRLKRYITHIELGVW